MVSIFRQQLAIIVVYLVCLDHVVASGTVTVNFTLNRVAFSPCIGEEVGLTNTSIQFQYRTISNSSAIGDWITKDAIPLLGGGPQTYHLNFDSTVEGMQFRLLQLEHGGGPCNCWEVQSFAIAGANITQACYSRGTNSRSINEFYCDGIASDARGVISHALYFNDVNGEDCPGDSSSILISNKGHLLPQDCSTAIPRIEVVYGLLLSVEHIGSDSCDGVDGGDAEYIEFAMCNNTNGGPWIPLQLNYHNASIPPTRVVRGYNVPASTTSSTNVVQHTVHICGDVLRTSQVQFRWMGTAELEQVVGTNQRRPRNDIWALTNVNATLIDNDNETTSILEDGFGCDDTASCTLNSSRWNNPRRGSLSCTACLMSEPCLNHYLTFGANNETYTQTAAVIVGRIALTQAFLVELFNTMSTTDLEAMSTTNTTSTTPEATTPDVPTTISTTTASTTPEVPTTSATTVSTTPEATTPEVPTTISTTPEATTPEVPTTMSTTTEVPTNVSTSTVSPLVSSLVRTEKSLQEMIRMNKTLEKVINTTDPLEAVDLVQNLTTNGEQPSTAIYLLGTILNRLNSTDINPQDQLSRAIIRVGNSITQQNVKLDPAITGSSLLSVNDQLALEVFQEDGNISTENIVLNSRQLSPEGEASSLVTTINSADFNDTLPEMSLQIPHEFVQIVSRSGNGSERVRVVAFLYYNVENLFPSGLQMEENNTELASGIISTALQVGESRYPTENLKLGAPIRIQMKHSDKIKDRMLNDSNLEITCVFWEFVSGRSVQGNSILSVGQWSDRGCNRSDTLSNSSVTVCECNHLTHFAILLSARPLNLTQPVTLSLQIIGYVGVSISLVAMALTVIIFIALKPLRNIRSFIHINLCISLGIAQLIFLIGVTRSDPTGDRVPVHCQVTAVLLHYFFLVSFMWMLMEGVVLYIILVKVFVTRTKWYMLVFMLVSYGVPLLYMGLLTLPLGFALPTQPNYGYPIACFVNPGTSFIWVFIAPVVVIILADVGLFTMAAVVMWRHKKRQTGAMNKKDIKKWLLALVPLVMIMGLTWVFGVLIVEVKELLPFAYIYTIMVAFQGLFIFLLFVVFPKQVRDEYAKWWTKVKTHTGKNMDATNIIALKITGQISNSKMNANTNVSGSGGFKVEEVVLKSKAELSLVKENPYAETCVSTEENHEEIISLL